MPVNDFTRYPMSWRPARPAKGDGPAYSALAAALAKEIGEGRLPPGTRLPPQRELADFLDLDFTTITRAYDLCRSRGLVYGVTGRGTFVASGPAAESGEVRCAADLGIVRGFPSIGRAAPVEAAKRVLSRESAERIFGYGDRDGRPAALAAGRMWLESRGIPAGPGSVSVFPGVQGALSAALFSLFAPGEALAVDVFTYGNLISLSKLSRTKLVPVAGDGAGMLPEALDKAAARQRVRGVFLMPDCANPTARAIPSGRREELAEVAKRRDLFILEDGADLGGSVCKTLRAIAPERTVYMSGSTRFAVPGIRATFVAAPEKLKAALAAALHYTAIKASALDAEILSELVVSGGADRILAEKRKACAKANGIFDGVFGDARKKRRTESDCRLFRTVPMPGTAGRGRAIESEFAARGVSVFHSDRFRAGAAAGESFLRVSISNAPGGKTLHRHLGILRREIENARLRGTVSPRRPS